MPKICGQFARSTVDFLLGMQQEITYIGYEGNIIQTADQDPYTHYLKQISATLAKKKCSP